MFNGDANYCLISNTPTPVPVEVTKVWEVAGAGGLPFDRDALITIGCDAEIVGGNDLGGSWTRVYDLDDSDGAYDDKDGDDIGLATVTAWVIPSWYKTEIDPDDQQYSQCWATENGVPSSVEVTSDCGTLKEPGMEVAVGMGASCTITNTQFFEGIPTLSRFGMAIMALLMLGIGMVGFRRFA